MGKCTNCGLSSETNSFIDGDVLKCKCGAVISNIYRGNIKQYIMFSIITLISGIIFYYGFYLYGNDKEMNDSFRGIWALSLVIHPALWFVLVKGNWWFKKQNTNIQQEQISGLSSETKDTFFERLIAALIGKPLEVSIFVTLVGFISIFIVYFDRKYDFFLWRTDTILGGMEKLNFLGNENFISIGQYIVGTLIYSSLIFGILFSILMAVAIIERVIIKIKEIN